MRDFACLMSFLRERWRCVQCASTADMSYHALKYQYKNEHTHCTGLVHARGTSVRQLFEERCEDVGQALHSGLQDNVSPHLRRIYAAIIDFVTACSEGTSCSSAKVAGLIIYEVFSYLWTSQVIGNVALATMAGGPFGSASDFARSYDTN